MTKGNFRKRVLLRKLRKRERKLRKKIIFRMTLWYYKEKRQKVPLASKIVQRDFFDIYADWDDIPAEILFLALLSLHDHLDVVAALQEYILEEVGNLFATEALHKLLIAGIVIETETCIVGKNA